MKRNVFTIHIAFMPESNRHNPVLPQFICYKEEFGRDCLVKLMEEFVAFNALFTWPRMSLEEAESAATQPVVYMAGLPCSLLQLSNDDGPDVIVIIGNEGTSGPVEMKRQYRRSIVLWSTYSNADQRNGELFRVLTANGVLTCHDLSPVALKARVHELLAEKYGVTFPS